MKKYENNTVKIFMEQGGKRFNSASKALKFVRRYRKYYSVEDLKKLEALSTGSQNRTDVKVKKDVPDKKIQKSINSQELIEKDLENQNKAVQKSKELASPSTATATEEWEVDDTKYPKGWMYYRYSKKNQHGKIYYQQRFMAPNKQKFPGIRAPLAHMIKTNFPESEIMMMRRAMAESGWRNSENLP